MTSSRTVIHAVGSSVESDARASNTKIRSSVLARAWDWKLERPMHSPNICRTAKILKVDKSHSSARMAA
ncbi:hypothetical protein CsSME_00030073 [Camellia sinensis var. sinensis]